MLISAVSQALGVLPLSTSSPAIANAIMQAFVREDDRIMRLARSAATWHQPVSPQAYYALGPAMSGSCALLSMYDPKSCTLRVANTGDSRAVLGRWDAESGGYTCIPLSEDQNGFNPDEVSRIKEAHPGEDEILDPATGRLLGMAVTRAFGNHRWKWDDDMVRKVKAKFFGVGPCPHLKTPPYMTAEPVVKEVQVVSVDAEEENRRGTNAKSDFLIMASDGLWGYMSSEDAVLLVQRWLEARERGNGIVQADPQLEQRLTADREKRNKSVEEQLGYKPEDVGYVGWRATPEFFAVEDENAAICLYRNVLGGTRRWLQAGLRYMPQSIRRNAIDDTTIMVVFFDKLGQEGQMQKVTGEVTGKAKNWWWPW
jgi:pyruvate dehydrogenase phosphatase